jgi:hypothetical protein
MSNTIVTTKLIDTPHSGLVLPPLGDLVFMTSLVSDGTNETNTILFTRSTYDATTSNGRLMWVKGSGTGAGLIKLNWDQTTPFIACAFNPLKAFSLDFREFGGVKNPNGSGATGKLTITTTGLSSGDVFTIYYGLRLQ